MSRIDLGRKVEGGVEEVHQCRIGRMGGRYRRREVGRRLRTAEVDVVGGEDIENAIMMTGIRIDRGAIRLVGVRRQGQAEVDTEGEVGIGVTREA